MLSPPPLRRRVAEVMRFGIVGLGATAVHYVTAVALVQLFAFNLYVANILAFLTAFLSSFWMHHRWTFKSQRSLASAGPRFLAVALTGFACSNIGLMLAVHFGIGSPYLLFVISVLVVPAVTFTLSKIWAFKD